MELADKFSIHLDSPCQRALSLPEIIANVVREGAAIPGLLYSTLLVNRIFYHETCPVLWYGCGHNSPTAYEHVTPDIDDLVCIVRKNKSRAQHYANLIHHLVFNEAEPDDLLQETSFHQELSVLKFPRLTEVIFLENGTSTASINTGDVVIYYAQPNVTEFGLMGGSQISDDFLEALVHCCPKLRWLTIHTIENTVTGEGLAKFLRSAILLDFFDVRKSFKDAWTYETFQAMACHERIQMAFVPIILEEWISKLSHDGYYHKLFPVLKHLQTGVSDDSLSLIAKHAPNLDSLFLELQHLPPSSRILASASKFNHLTDLVISFAPGSHVHGQDIVQVVQGCPVLRSLHISEKDSIDGSGIPNGQEITDAIFSEATKHMPHIKMFSIFLEPPALLSYLSIMSFAQNCKELELFSISCNCNWKEVVKEVARISFPALEMIEVASRWNDGPGTMPEDFEMQELSEILSGMMPKLKNFSIDNGNILDTELVSRMISLIVDRDESHGSVSESQSLDSVLL